MAKCLFCGRTHPQVFPKNWGLIVVRKDNERRLYVEEPEYMRYAGICPECIDNRNLIVDYGDKMLQHYVPPILKGKKDIIPTRWTAIAEMNDLKEEG